MLIKVDNIAKPGSQHAKYLPIIQHTISELKNEKVPRRLGTITKHVRLPKSEDIEMEIRQFGGRQGELGTGSFPKHEKDADTCLLLRKMRGFEDGFAPVETLVEEIMRDGTPTFKLSIGTLTVFTDFEPAIPEILKEEWKSIATRLKWALETRGYRQVETETPFEHALIGDAGCAYSNGGLYKNKEIDFSRQHVPLSILVGKLTVPETATARELNAVCGSFPEFYGLKTMDNRQVAISLEPIGENGKTLWLPVAIDKTKLADALKRLPAPLAYQECALPGAKLDVAAVEESVKNSFGR